MMALFENHRPFEQIFERVEQYYWVLAVAITCCIVFYNASGQWSRSPLPIVKRSWREMLQYSNPVTASVVKGYNKYIKSGKPFRIWYWTNEYTVLPMKYLVDIKRADKEHVDFFRSIADVFYMKYWLHDLFGTDRMVYTVVRGLNPNLNEATQICIEEADDAFFRELGDCNDFTSVSTLEAFCGIAHHIAARILVGSTLSRDPAFTKASYSYFQGHAITGGILLFLPLGPLRDLLAKPMSYFQRLRQRRVLKLVVSEFEKRTSNPDKHKSEIDGIEWSLKVTKEYPVQPGAPPPYHAMSHELVHLLGAAHTPVGMIIMQMLWQALIQPESLKMLRKEAEEAVAQVGMTDRMVEHLPLQDSFIRETNRRYSTNTLGIQREICGKPFVMHDGLTLPVGTRVAFPIGPYLLDENVFENPEKFDGYRYTKLVASSARTENGVNRWVASHAHLGNLAFGYGNHVCPGRFFAVRLIKVIFTKLILGYDIKSEWKGDGMPPRTDLEGFIFPHTSASISLRKRVLT